MTRKKTYTGNRQRYGRSLLFLLCIFIPSLLQAQSAGIKYLRYTRHNFLASNQVNCIIQDKKKFMWFATSNGIQRFDGNRWLWLSQKRNAANSLPDNNVEWLLEDKQERFWVQTASGICVLDRNNFGFTKVSIAWLPEHTNHEVQSIVELKDGHVWITVAGGGLYYYDESTKQFVTADRIIASSQYTFYQLAYDSLHRQYFLGSDHGLMIYDLSNKVFYHAGNNPNGLALLSIAPSKQAVISMYVNDKGQLWFSNFSTHSCYDIKTNRIIFCDSSSKIAGILGYTTDQSGTTWGYGATIAKMNLASGKIELIEQSADQLYGISFQNGGYMMEDNEHTYWIATTNGVFIYNRFQQQFMQHPIKSYATGKIFEHINTWGFIKLPDSGVVALTTRGEGLYFFDKNLQQVPSKFNLSRYANAKSWVNIRCGIRDAEGHLWVACERGPLLKLYPGNGQVEEIHDTVFSSTGIYSMSQDREGNIWFGSFKHDIIRRDFITGRFSKIVSANDHTTGLNNVFCLFYDGNRYIWAATSKSGLLKINTQTKTVEKAYEHKTGDSKSIPSSQVFTVTATSYNELLMSTPLGMVAMDIEKESFRLLTTADGLPDNNVASLLKGKKRHVWFASDNGISTMKLDGMKMTSYGILEGLTNEMYNIGATAELDDGRMLFGHNEGFTSFDPAVFSNEQKPADVRITGIRLFDKYLNVDSVLSRQKGLVLNYSQNFLTIEFSNMSLLGRYHNVYYYQLEGVDEDWKTTNGMPQATYTYLPGGDYTFKVKCITRSGIVSNRITSFTIKIIPPVWKQWWFYVLGIAFISGLVYLFLRSRDKQKMDAEKGRNRIAKDLHDDMGSALSTINILSEMAKTKIDTDIPATKKFIHQISDNSNRIMESLDDIVWNIDTANDTIENTFSRMREFAGNLLEARGISYSFKEDEYIKNISLELGRRHDFFMIFKEAVNNLAKYSECTTAAIEVYIKRNILVLVITDNGKGFTHNPQFEGNGLTNMHQRAAALKGILTVHSEINKGTTIQLTVPL